jgi:hypothetical protein
MALAGNCFEEKKLHAFCKYETFGNSAFYLMSRQCVCSAYRELRDVIRMWRAITNWIKLMAPFSLGRNENKKYPCQGGGERGVGLVRMGGRVEIRRLQPRQFERTSRAPSGVYSQRRSSNREIKTLLTLTRQPRHLCVKSTSFLTRS